MNTLGRYDILRELGRGGMGVVYLGHDPMIDRPVAIKTLILSDEQAAENLREESRTRFAREARAAGRLSHPGIVMVYDVGIEADTNLPFIAMEYVEGRSLKQLLDESGPPEPARIHTMALQLAEALAYAHGGGVIHRDLKPANIMLDERGRARITDFGLARLAESSLTRAGAVLGSPSYAAPEQLKGNPVDERSDIYSLGVTLYKLLTGELPYPGQNLPQIIMAVLEDDAPPPSNHRTGLDPAWDQLVMNLMARDPDRRPAGMMAVRGLLREQAVDLTAPVAGEKSEQPAPAKTRPASAGEQSDSGLRLQIVEGPLTGQSFPVREGTTIIGRRAGQVRINDPEASSQHCEITMFGGQIFLKDLKSRNGTYLEDRRISFEELRPGMSIRVGKTRLKIVVPEEG